MSAVPSRLPIDAPAARFQRLLSLVAIVLGATMVWATCSAPSVAATSASRVAVSLGPQWQGLRTVSYRTTDGVTLPISLFAPVETTHPVPVIVEVHGGGWQHGSRLTSLSESGTATQLVAAGFMVASVDYRLAPQAPWPDQIIDVENAVRFLRSHAQMLGISPDRMGALGTSAGGQLVSLLGLASTVRQWDQGPYAGTSGHVDAVVDEFGPANLGAGNWPHPTEQMIRTVFGASPNEGTNAVLRAASPLTYPAAGDPPFLIIQGTDDHVVPASQSEDLAARLRATGSPVDLVLVEHGGHGLLGPDQSPSPSAVSSLITRYLVKLLH